MVDRTEIPGKPPQAVTPASNEIRNSPIIVPWLGQMMVGDTGFEPVTSSVSVISAQPENPGGKRKRGPWVYPDDCRVLARLTSSLTGLRQICVAP
jgi:hypothetical protein